MKAVLQEIRTRLFPAYTDEDFDTLLWCCTAYPFASEETMRKQLQFAADVGNDIGQVWYIADGLMHIQWQEMKRKNAKEPTP